MIALSVPATEVKVGDYIGRKNRVALVLVRKGKVLAKITTRGARSPSVKTWKVTDSVIVLR